MPGGYELPREDAAAAIAAHGADLDELARAGAPVGETVDLMRLAAWLIRELKERDHGAAKP